MESSLSGEMPSYSANVLGSQVVAIGINNKNGYPVGYPQAVLGEPRPSPKGLEDSLEASAGTSPQEGLDVRAVPPPRPSSGDRLNWERDCSRNAARRHLILRGCRVSLSAPSLCLETWVCEPGSENLGLPSPPRRHGGWGRRAHNPPGHPQLLLTVL